jgi:hypothetical protein
MRKEGLAARETTNYGFVFVPSVFATTVDNDEQLVSPAPHRGVFHPS